MTNPFYAKFDSTCDECGEDVYEDDTMFAHDGTFICSDCASAYNLICACGNYKKKDYETCYKCFSEDE